MSTEVRHRRGTTAQHTTFTGAQGEVTVDTDKKAVVVHDGVTAGGFPTLTSINLATKANLGANSDITSLSGLTTPLSLAQGGTAAITAAAARTSLGVAASGANIDIVAISAIGSIGSGRNIRASLTANGTTILFTADDVAVGTALNSLYRRLASYSQTLNIATVGAGGMDIGTAPASGFVAIYAIAQAGGTQSILGVNAVTSTGSIYSGANMPSGYTYSALIAIIPTNATPQLLACLVQDRHIDFVPIGIVVAGTLSATLTTQSISVGVPVTAKTADLQFIDGNNSAFKYQSAGNANGIGIQATGGSQDVSSRSSGGGMSSGYAACQHRKVPLITAQTVFVASLGSGGADSMYVTGYDI